MKRLRHWTLGLLALLIAAILIDRQVDAQTANYMPIPSNVCAAKGAVLVAQDVDKVTCVADVAAGQVLVSGGVGALPAFSASPTLTAATIPTLTTATSLTLGGGTAITKIRVFAPTCSPSASSAAIQTAEQSCTVSGVTTADKIIVNGPAPTSLCPLVGARVSGADTVALMFTTLTASACTPASGTYNIVAIRS